MKHAAFEEQVCTRARAPVSPMDAAFLAQACLLCSVITLAKTVKQKGVYRWRTLRAGDLMLEYLECNPNRAGC
jgi:hypothetical protein